MQIMTTRWWTCCGATRAAWISTQLIAWMISLKSFLRMKQLDSTLVSKLDLLTSTQDSQIGSGPTSTCKLNKAQARPTMTLIIQPSVKPRLVFSHSTQSTKNSLKTSMELQTVWTIANLPRSSFWSKAQMKTIGLKWSKITKSSCLLATSTANLCGASQTEQLIMRLEQAIWTNTTHRCQLFLSQLLPCWGCASSKSMKRAQILKVSCTHYKNVEN